MLPEFPLEKRATATALWGATGAVAAATGPALGGLLVGWQSWRWVFFVNLLIGIPALVPARRILRETPRAGRRRCPDALGAVLLAVGVGALALAIVQGPDWGWSSARVIGAFVLSAVSLVLFLVRSSRHPAPVIELSLFKVRSFAVANAGGFVFALGFYALLLCNVLFLTGVWGYSIVKAGVAVTPGPLMAALSAPIGGRLSDRFGQRVVAVPGGLVFAAGALLFATTVDASSAYATEFLPATILTGIGVGLSFASFGSAAVAELPRDRFATGGAINNTFRQIGAALGISALIAVLGPAAGVDISHFHRAWALMAITGGRLRPAGRLGRVGRNVGEPAAAPEPSSIAPACPGRRRCRSRMRPAPGAGRDLRPAGSLRAAGGARGVAGRDLERRHGRLVPVVVLGVEEGDAGRVGEGDVARGVEDLERCDRALVVVDAVDRAGRDLAAAADLEVPGTEIDVCRREPQPLSLVIVLDLQVRRELLDDVGVHGHGRRLHGPGR